MCEKLFKHVGQFREHATEQVIKIVDSLHEPDREKDRDKDRRPAGKEEAAHKMSRSAYAPAPIDKSLIPLALEKILDDQRVFMDEDDNTLYFSGPGKREIEERRKAGLPGQGNDTSDLASSAQLEQPSFQKHNIFSKDKILYKLAHKDELLYTISNDGSTNSNPAKYVNQNQANIVGAFDAISTIQSHRNPTSQGANTHVSHDKSHSIKPGRDQNQKVIEKWKLFGR